MRFKWLLLLLPGGVVFLLAVQIVRVLRSEVFRSDVQRCRAMRQIRRAERRAWESQS